VDLRGANENPANPSTAFGNALLTLDGDFLTVDLSFADLTGGPAGAAHIHCCVPRPGNTGIAIGFPGFPNTTSDTYTHTFDLTNSAVYTSTFLGVGAGARQRAAAGYRSIGGRAPGGCRTTKAQLTYVRRWITTLLALRVRPALRPPAALRAGLSRNVEAHESVSGRMSRAR